MKSNAHLACMAEGAAVVPPPATKRQKPAAQGTDTNDRKDGSNSGCDMDKNDGIATLDQTEDGGATPDVAH